VSNRRSITSAVPGAATTITDGHCCWERDIWSVMTFVPIECSTCVPMVIRFFYYCGIEN
jgi:hypothetical protein